MREKKYAPRKMIKIRLYGKTFFFFTERIIGKARQNEDSANKATAATTPTFLQLAKNRQTRRFKTMFFLNKYETVISVSNFAVPIVQIIEPSSSSKNEIA